MLGRQGPCLTRKTCLICGPWNPSSRVEKQAQGAKTARAQRSNARPMSIPASHCGVRQESVAQLPHTLTCGSLSKLRRCQGPLSICSRKGQIPFKKYAGYRMLCIAFCVPYTWARRAPMQKGQGDLQPSSITSCWHRPALCALRALEALSLPGSPSPHHASALCATCMTRRKGGTRCAPLEVA